MGKAEVGSAKYVANKMKARGLQKLKWYCQPCEKQMRDENGFKCHCLSDSHMKRVSREGAYGSVARYSHLFEQEFLYALRTSHGEKTIGLNRFYNEFVQNRDHVHMNATRWQSLASFAASLARRGLIKLEEHPEGKTISMIDNSASIEMLKREMQANDAKLSEDAQIELDREQRAKIKAHAEAEAEVEAEAEAEAVQLSSEQTSSGNTDKKETLTSTSRIGGVHLTLNNNTITPKKPTERKRVMLG